MSTKMPKRQRRSGPTLLDSGGKGCGKGGGDGRSGGGRVDHDDGDDDDGGYSK